MKKATLTFIFSFLAFAAVFAQENGAEMADTMRKEGKIYVVIAVILTIFAGLVLYLVRLDRKISKLEKSA
jgi:uncharacterized transporter YbjL